MTARAAMTYAGKVGRAVRYLRETKGIDLETMAKSMGMSKSGWSRLETGDSVMTVEQLRRAAVVLQRKPSEVLSFTEIP